MDKRGETERGEMLDVVMEKMEMVSETVEQENDQLTEEGGGRRTFRRKVERM